MFDIGVNFHSRPLAASVNPLVDEAKEAGVAHILATGTSWASSKNALALAATFPGYLFATAGVHPHNASNWNLELATGLSGLWQDPRVVAVGECGLDYNRMFSTRAQQLSAFEAQLEAAIHHQKPLFLHSRDAFSDFHTMTKAAAESGARGVVHCFTGTPEEAVAHLESGFDIGVTGWIADVRRGSSLRDAIKVIPLDRLHLETDSPYLTPANMPNPSRVNKPANIAWIAKAVAREIGQDWESVATACSNNSRKMFMSSK